jgi:hypothetical protein
MGPRIQWLHSYVAANKIYCIYIADDKQAIRKHAEQGGFPVNRIEQISSVIDPTTSD